MHWLLLTILALCSRALYGLSTKMLTNNAPVSPVMTAVLICGLGTIFTIPFMPWLGGISFHGLSEVWLPCVIVVLCVSFGGVLYFKGQKHLDVGTTQIAFSSILLWATVLSIVFLGSRFSLAQGLGIVLLLCAILMAQYRKGTRHLNTFLLYIIVSAALFAGFQTMSAVIADQLTPATYMLIGYGGTAIFLTITNFGSLRREARDLLVRRSSTIVYSILFAVTTSTLYWIMAYFAYRTAPDPGLVVILMTGQAILGVLLGAAFLGERSNLILKLAAGALAVVAAVLIKS